VAKKRTKKKRHKLSRDEQVQLWLEITHGLLEKGILDRVESYIPPTDAAEEQMTGWYRYIMDGRRVENLLTICDEELPPLDKTFTLGDDDWT
jgi:hypothetical protein